MVKDSEYALIRMSASFLEAETSPRKIYSDEICFGSAGSPILQKAIFFIVPFD